MKPRLLDLFCGAGGAAMGYHRAGFEIIGVDHAKQPNYPFRFRRCDVFEWVQLVGLDRIRDEFDAIHASPPCQAFSKVTNRSRGRGGVRNHRENHSDLVGLARDQLLASGLPYVIENVPGAPLVNPVQLCGSFFGLDLQRHRWFETNWPLMSTPCSHHWQRPRFRSLDIRQISRGSLASVVGVHGHLNYPGERELREQAMDIGWMTPAELVEAIPPAYTELIGHQLLQHLNARAASSEDATPNSEVTTSVP